MPPSEESDPSSNSDNLLFWLEDTVSFLPSFLDENIDDYQWLDHCHQQDFIDIDASITSLDLVDILPALDVSKKRKSPSRTPSSKSPKQLCCQVSESNDNGAVVEEVVKVKITKSSKRSAAKESGNNGNGCTNKEGRWAEQLLNPCAVAISNGNLTRVQHLLYVLHELASPSGDSNYRLASHGLRALTHHLSCNTSSSTVSPITFASTEPRFFQHSLLKFNEISPWFAFPNTVANASVLQLLAQEPDCSRNLHIVDIGVSHGLQWPTLLEALSHRTGGPPPLIRLTIVGDNGVAAPFSKGPTGDDFASRLLRFAKSINLNLQINLLNNHSLQRLNAQTLNTSPDETLIFCAQFRLHSLNHTTPDGRTEFLKVLRNFEPKGVILCENDMECSCTHCGDFATGFSRRVENLWRFLDSTSVAFKGRECEERRVMEGEAAIGLMNGGLEMNEGKEKWYGRMKGAGFASEVFGEDATDGARALLRKYDSNWEMRIDERDGCFCLSWKGQPVSFCSLWTLEKNATHS